MMSNCLSTIINFAQVFTNKLAFGYQFSANYDLLTTALYQIRQSGLPISIDKEPTVIYITAIEVSRPTTPFTYENQGPSVIWNLRGLIGRNG